MKKSCLTAYHHKCQKSRSKEKVLGLPRWSRCAPNAGNPEVRSLVRELRFLGLALRPKDLKKNKSAVAAVCVCVSLSVC